MASHGAVKEVAATEPARPKKMPKEVARISFEKAGDGSLAITHDFSHYEHKSEIAATLQPGEVHKAGEHIAKHFGIKMPGKSSVDSAAPKEGDENEE